MSLAEIVVWTAKAIMGLVLMAAGISKLRSGTWSSFAVEAGTPRLVVVTLPAVESLIGLALVLHVGGVWVALAGLLLFIAFTGVVAWLYFSKSEAPCNCFGGTGKAVTKLTITRNIDLVLLGLIAVS